MVSLDTTNLKRKTLVRVENKSEGGILDLIINSFYSSNGFTLLIFNSITAKAVLVGEKLVAMYSIST